MVECLPSKQKTRVRFPLVVFQRFVYTIYAPLAYSVEHYLSKVKVAGSIPARSLLILFYKRKKLKGKQKRNKRETRKGNKEKGIKHIGIII